MKIQRLIKINTIFLLVVSVFLFPHSVFAQTAQSNCVITKIGNPEAQPVLPPGCQATGPGGGATGPCGPVVDWSAKIADSLTVGGGGYLSGDGYDNRTQDFSSDCGATLPRAEWAGQYWCTYLVIDAYNLAGIPGLSNANGDAYVPTMHAHWRSMPGFFTLDYFGQANKSVIQQVKPGFAIFFGDDDHVGLVKSISYDEHGNGTLETHESNSSEPSHKWPIAEWKVINGFSILAFGGHN